ncbi:mucin-17 [Artibeus jamaicensis]|uniref:mucin-17 n=1 Tax=Artibeus jamaicensis TaxID=9417 RepID=UPI00235A5A9A|nr:mucin-17 [Artibeus jamaicensis]
MHPSSASPEELYLKYWSSQAQLFSRKAKKNRTFDFPVKCLNGGTWNGKACDCLPGFRGDTCQSETVVCQNGGSWDGIKCVCTSLYQGQRCEEVVSSIEIKPPETVSAEMKLSVTVTSVNYTDKLQDRSSLEFQNFSKLFTNQMDFIYAEIPEYEGINITELIRGSVVVKHDVLLKTNFTLEYEEVLKNATEKIEQKINYITNEQVMVDNNCTSMLCFKENATKVQSISITQYSPEEECREKAGKNFADYFFVVYEDQKPKCISRCEPGFNTSLNCNYGKCMLERSGPRCYCLTTDTDWYRGETCEFSTKKSLVYGLLGAAGAVILIVLVIILVFVFRFRREVKRQKSKVTQLNKWHGEDGEKDHGTFQNMGFDTCEEQENSIDLDSIYSNFQPTLDHIDSNKKIKFQRPQVMLTSL